MNKDVFLNYESEVRSYCRKWPVVFDTAKGSTLIDVDGNSYLDFFNGAGALDYGHNPDYIKNKLIDYLQRDGIVHSLDMHAKAKGEFIDFFQNEVLKPRGYDYKIMFAGPTGTNANESALKLARKVTGRSNVFALNGAFHGMTLGTLSLTGDLGVRAGGGVDLSNVTHIPAPYYNNGSFDTISYLDELLSDDHSGVDKPAAIILETVQAEGGIHVFSKEFLKGIREICDKYDILMICDEIQVGCSRTGTFFSFERADVVPDMVTMSKSIGGYGLPLGLLLLKPELDIWSPGEHNGTFRGVQLSLVAAKAGLEIMINENVPEQVKRKEAIVREFLDNEIKPMLEDKQEIRGIGLIWGIEFNDGKLARAVLDKCFENKLLVELAGRGDSVLKIMPSLVIDEESLIKGLNIIKESMKEVLGR